MMLFAIDFSQEANSAWTKLVETSLDLGERILAAIVIFLVGKFIVRWLNKLFAKLLEKQKVEPGVQTFLKSMVNILLLIMLGFAVVGKLGIELTGFAALLASAGVAIGMALSGNLQNFAGGLIILIFRPYKVGDYIESSSGASGTVKEIQIFHTVLVTPDNKVIYAPNGSMSNAVTTNYSQNDTRRIDLVFGVEYGENIERVQQVLKKIIEADKRILTTPEPFVLMGDLADSSINFTVRVWVNSSDYWAVYFDMKETVYTTFNQEGISIPYPQLVVHQAQ